MAATCRAALIATLLPDPGTPEKRAELCEKIGGKVVKKIERKKMPNGQVVEREKEETVGGILHWKRETENAETLEWFRQEIRKAYGGRAPKVLDPFAGGGAIPLEAMRLGCEVTASDINPVAWFILKCTLEYPQKLAGQTRPLPAFVLSNGSFMLDFFTKGKKYSKAEAGKALRRLGKRMKDREQETFDFGTDDGVDIEADLAWQVRAWGQWVLDRARRELAEFYPTYADFEPLKKDQKSYERQPMKFVPLHEDGTPDIDAFNAEFSEEYLADKKNPRWVAKPTVAYLWARTVTCKNCRATVPLLKTRWLCKKAKNRVLLTMEPSADRAGVALDVETDVPAMGGNVAQRREHDKRMGAGTMSRAGATCPCCDTIMTTSDIRVEGKAGRLDVIPTAVVVDGQKGRDYRTPTQHELDVVHDAARALETSDAQLPFGLPNESTPKGGGRGAARAFSVQSYGMYRWRDLFLPRQLCALSTLITTVHEARTTPYLADVQSPWRESILAYLALAVDRVAERNSTGCHWDVSRNTVSGTFQRYALPINWDFAEASPFGDAAGSFIGQIEWVTLCIAHTLKGTATAPPRLRHG